MILCTHYGLLIYEWNLISENQNKKDETVDEELKDSESDADENLLKI